MRKQLVAVSVMLVSGLVGNAQEKPPVHVVIQATSEQVKKGAIAMFARKGYTVDSDVALQLKISRPFSDDETAAYNTARWTNQPVANCRHVGGMSGTDPRGTASDLVLKRKSSRVSGSILVLRSTGRDGPFLAFPTVRQSEWE